ncbi:hypothetical protein [Aquimarina sp. 2201CG14-23]|uniref:hypothetical protein n=1 Tax=Aquimarina mycalae TaxID=3040073 RepID=UPI0024780F16|nr:hypothetical protein [Aquimarina sp. 2201CG14-23]MDH7446921.1 hypothetical protein [Aquimarina sp. 2201CG14-23]
MLQQILNLEGVQKLSIDQRQNIQGGFGPNVGEDWEAECRPSNCHPACYAQVRGCF